MSEPHSGCPCGSFSPMTHVAGLCAILFVLFLFFETTTIRWWLMLPLAAVSFGLFSIQRGQTTGVEQTVCRFGTWIVAIAFVLRDMCLSGQLVAIHQKLHALGISLNG